MVNVISETHLKAQALVELIGDEFKLTDDERDIRGKGGKSRGTGVTQWAGRKDCLGHAGHKGALGEDGGGGGPMSLI